MRIAALVLVLLAAAATASACGSAVRPAAATLVRKAATSLVAEEAANAGRKLLREVPGDGGSDPGTGTPAPSDPGVGRFAADVAASDAAAATITACTGDALDATAEHYADAVSAGDPAPALDAVFTDTLFGCLTTAYPGEDAVAADVTAVVRDQVARATARAAAAGLTPQGYYEWMKATAATLRAGTATS